jgi:hypothetical protein
MIGLGLRLGITAAPIKGGGGGVSFRQKMGVHPYTPGVAGLTTWDSWYGGTTDLVTVFVSHSNWSAWDISIANVVTNYAGDARPKVWTVGLNVTGTTLDDAAAGLFNNHYQDAAAAALADAPASGSILVRLGHEFNLVSTYPWSTIDSGKWAQYVAAYRQAVNTFRSVSPRFRFIWCINWITLPNPTTTDLTPAWPGDAYVDIVATDLYYDTDADAVPSVAFNYARDLPNCGLTWLANFAAAHGKPLALCEFGLAWDRPQWVDLVYQWVKANNVAYFSYWDHAAGNYRISDGSKPDSTSRFRATFRDKGPSPIFNHTFAFDNEGFSGSGSSVFSVASQIATITNVSDFTQRAQRGWLTGLTIGQQYRVELDIHTGGKNGRAMVLENASPFAILGSIILNTAAAWQHTSFNFTATQTAVMIRVLPYAGDAAQVVQFDNVQLFAV